MRVFRVGAIPEQPTMGSAAVEAELRRAVAMVCAAEAASGDGGQRVIAVEITSVLNCMAQAVLQGTDGEVIDRVDAVMNDLYQGGVLTCPGHRWMPEPPSSIRGHLVSLFEGGAIYRIPANGTWGWHEVTSFFVLWPQPVGLSGLCRNPRRKKALRSAEPGEIALEPFEGHD